MWVLIDNYDSFTGILHHYLLLTGQVCQIFRNDAISVSELRALHPERIIISPGPETPLQAGICMEVIDAFHQSVPILGICLGHQALGMYFGARLIRAPRPVHGKASPVIHQGHPLFHHIPSPFIAMRYHSLAVSVPEMSAMEVIAHAADDSQVMALVHRTYPCIGVQFHPESAGTEAGMQLIRNWAEMFC